MRSNSGRDMSGFTLLSLGQRSWLFLRMTVVLLFCFVQWLSVLFYCLLLASLICCCFHSVRSVLSLCWSINFCSLAFSRGSSQLYGQLTYSRLSYVSLSLLSSYKLTRDSLVFDTFLRFPRITLRLFFRSVLIKVVWGRGQSGSMCRVWRLTVSLMCVCSH